MKNAYHYFKLLYLWKLVYFYLYDFFFSSLDTLFYVTFINSYNKQQLYQF